MDAGRRSGAEFKSFSIAECQLPIGIWKKNDNGRSLPGKLAIDIWKSAMD
jgi:hypothetical protein